MILKTLHALSLQRLLLLLLVPGLLLIGAVEVLQTWRIAVDATNAAYDRSLLGAIKSMDANVSTASGGLGLELPYRMLEFFELTASGQVYYRVATEDGMVEVGNADLPMPPNYLVTEQPYFTDASYFNEAVRIGTYARVLEPPLPGQAAGQRLVIQVAETLESRQTFTHALVLRSIARDVLLLGIATALVVLAVGWALRPLARLRGEVQARAAEDLTPISVKGIPADVQPLVDAINFHVERSRQHSEARQRFIDDASHQLRTPLATLVTQVGFVLRETKPAQQREALEAIKTQLDETVRQTNQMLALARMDNSQFLLEALDVTALVEKATREWWQEARAGGVDLGFEPDAQALHLWVHPALLKEALSNLLHNAIRYTPRGGQVTVKLRSNQQQGLIIVTDNGPGLPPEELLRAGDRFFRGSQVTQPGSGLGLAIVKSIAHRLHGNMSLSLNPEGAGLTVVIALPRPAKVKKVRVSPEVFKV